MKKEIVYESMAMVMSWLRAGGSLKDAKDWNYFTQWVKQNNSDGCVKIVSFLGTIHNFATVQNAYDFLKTHEK